MSVFLDAGVLVAYANRDDPLHKDALRVLEPIGKGALGQPFTSDYVVAEALNFLRRKVRSAPAADELVEKVFGSAAIPPLCPDVLRVHGPLFADALTRYRQRWDAGLSFTDWTNIVLMEGYRIPAIATFDGGFGGWARVVR